MALLSIRLFGRLRVSLGSDAEIKCARTGHTLLAYLLLQRDYSPRDLLASLCWAEQPEDSARSCLNTALWRLRSALEPDPTPRGTYLLTGSDGEVGFNWQSPHWLDLAEFERAVSAALAWPAGRLTQSQLADLERALDLYTGDLLEGFYDDWALRERERQRGLYLDGLQHLMRRHALDGAYHKSVLAGQRILSLDPLREDVHRDLMRLYAADGQRALAVRQFMTCRETLAAELGIEPMDETETCYREILAKGGTAVQPSRTRPRQPPKPDLDAALAELSAARRQLQAAQERLNAALTTMEKFAPCA
jgi:DNA-binding SARP family transcriptional activator